AARIESPPSSKKFWSTPTEARDSTSRQRAASFSSISPRGAAGARSAAASGGGSRPSSGEPPGASGRGPAKANSLGRMGWGRPGRGGAGAWGAVPLVRGAPGAARAGRLDPGAQRGLRPAGAQGEVRPPRVRTFGQAGFDRIDEEGGGGVPRHARRRADIYEP